MGPRGGVVTQRSAKPCTPVQFRTWPPHQPIDSYRYFYSASVLKKAIATVLLPTVIIVDFLAPLDPRRSSVRLRANHTQPPTGAPCFWLAISRMIAKATSWRSPACCPHTGLP